MIKLENQGSQGGILFPSGNLVGNNVMPKPHHFQCPAASAAHQQNLRDGMMQLPWVRVLKRSYFTQERIPWKQKDENKLFYLQMKTD
jgi:hypothetical protein